jgi:hypothetical protein
VKSAAWRLHRNLLSPLVSLHYLNHLSVNRTYADRLATSRVSKLGIPGNSFPSANRKHSTPRVGHREEKPPGRVKAHRDQSSDEKMRGLRHAIFTARMC